MTITYVIPGTTTIDQLNETTSDGLADENANDNCVAASLAEALHILTGKNFNGDELKDAVYGQGYVGVQSAASYVPYCRSQGVDLIVNKGSQTELVNCLHTEVSAGHPVLVTMPSQWATAPANPVYPSGSTHVGVAVGVGPGMIRVMNPWHGFFQDQDDAWWQARLCYGQVWSLQKVGSSVSTVPANWNYANGVLTAPNGVQVVHGICDWVLTNAHDPTDIPLGPEFDANPVEIGNAALGAGRIQFFLKSGQVTWTQAKGVFATYNGQEMKALRDAVTSADETILSLQKQLAAAQAQIAADGNSTVALHTLQTLKQTLANI